MRKKQKKIDEEYDTPWKTILTSMFPEFLEAYFPHIHAQVDRKTAPVFRDKELAKVMRGAKVGNRVADKVVEVRLLDGKKAAVFVHVEVQVCSEPEFARRMFVYNSRLCEIFGDNVCSLALLADDIPNWIPSEFKRVCMGTKFHFAFEAVKLSKAANTMPEEEVGKPPNPFQFITQTHLAALQTKRLPRERFLRKKELVEALYQSTLSESQQHNVLLFLDWVLHLPPEIEAEFDKFQQGLEETMGKPYVLRAERKAFIKGQEQGIEKGIEKGRGQAEAELVSQALELRFNGTSGAYIQLLNNLPEPKLKELHKVLILSGDKSSIDAWFAANIPNFKPN